MPARDISLAARAFSRETWGLGPLSPVDEDDESDLIGTVIDVGGGAADPDLVKTLVHGRLRRAVRAQTHIGHVRKDLARTIDLTNKNKRV